MGASSQEQGLSIAPVRRRRARWLLYTALSLVVLMLVAAGGTYAYARRSLPQISGELRLPGLGAPVTVYRDTWGVPHIEAKTFHDLFMAQGYVVAQDRLWQMDLTRRAAAGRLSEVIGESTVPTDKFMRSLSLRRAAERSVPAMSPFAVGALEAYAEGVNAFIDQAIAENRLPVEFAILGYKPEPWTPVDSASIGKVMAYQLGDNFVAEVYRYMLRQKVGDDLTRELLPTYPADAVTIMHYQQAEAAPVTRVAELPPDDSQLDLAGLLETGVWPEEFIGSNNWVVSGKLTQSGKPLLANDPHLGLGTPAIWHQIHLVLTGASEHMNVIGVIFPGAPGVVIGHNEQVAWGVTNTGPDVQDLYIEKRNPGNPYEFEYQGHWEAAQVYREPIKVKGKPDVPFEVVVTRHGPIVSEVVGPKNNRPKEALALKWTAHNPSTELEAVLGFDRAANWAEFREALKGFHVPTQNFVFASVDGTIAYHAGGMVPIRAKGDGLVPVPGWTGEYEWTGYIPFDKMPEVVNPEEGFIATANNKAVDDAYPYFLTYAWAEPYRATRITEVIRSKSGLTADDMRLLQTDFTDLRARKLLPALLPYLQKAELTGAEKGALALLEGWNQVDAADQGAPLVFQFWYRHMGQKLYLEKMGEELMGQMDNSGNVTDTILLNAAQGNENTWMKNAGGIQTVTVEGFRSAVAALVELQGNNPQKWAWGEYHRMGPQHNLGSSVKPLGWFLNVKPEPIGGSNITVGAMAYDRKTGLVSHSAPWRQVVDLGDLNKSSDVVIPGESGHFLSPFYANQQKLHNQGQLHPQLFTPDTYRTGRKLDLRP